MRSYRPFPRISFPGSFQDRLTTNIIALKAYSTKITKSEISETKNYYNKSFLKYINSIFTIEGNSLDNWKNRIKESYEIFTYKNNKSLKNKIIFDKIFIHLNYSENTFDLESQKIRHIPIF